MELSFLVYCWTIGIAIDFVFSRTTSTSVPDLCFCKERPYYPQFEPFRYNDCLSCVHCGRVQHIKCREECINPEPEVEGDGVCCPICPNGPNCIVDDVIIPHGEQVQIGSKLCECLPLILGYDPKKSFCIDIPFQQHSGRFH